MSNEKRVSVADGKYTFVLSEPHDLIDRVLRHDEPWPAGQESFKHKNCVHALVWELYEAREKLKELEAFVKNHRLEI